MVTSQGGDPVISVMLAVPDAPAAVAWYKRALGATELWSLGSVAGLEISGAPFFLGEPAKNDWESPAKLGITSVRVEVFCDDPDAFVRRALEAGAKGSLDHIRNHEMPWGPHRQGGFVDPFGHIWFVGDKSPLHRFPAGTASSFDPKTAEAFAGRLLGVLNDGALCLMTSIGHRTGLFDAMRDEEPMTSVELASRAGLNERYVREWLGAMVTARIVQVDPPTMRFRLPPEHAAFLTRAAAADNLAVFAQYVGLLGGVEDDIVECFRKGGGVPYGKFPRFHAVMAEDSGQSVLSSIESHILPLIPGLADRLARGIRVLDVGCGRGRIMNRMAGLFPNSDFVGIDLSDEAVGAAREEAAAARLKNLEFVAADLSNFDQMAEPGSFDFITTFDAVHDQAKPLNVLKGIHRALKDDGVYLMQDIKGSSHVHNNLDHPIGTFLYTVSCMHCMTVSLAQDGEGLGAMWGEEMTRDYLERAGFRSMEKHELAHDIQNNWYVVRK